MRALVIQHDHVSPAGPVGRRLEERGYAVELLEIVSAEDFHRPGVERDYPDAHQYDVIVSMGAPWSTYDHDLIGSWVQPETALLHDADELGVPVLGICFGGQLIAQAHGGRVEASDAPEIGWVDIETDDAALVPEGPWFEWHYDRWQLPDGATELARNGAASQAFVLRRNLAVQFHPELTAAMLKGWLDNGGDEKATAHGCDIAQLLARTVELEEDSCARAAALVDAFLDRVAARPRPDRPLP